MGRLILRFTLLFLTVCMCSASLGFTLTCKEAERKALVQFKHSFIDKSSRLGSWVGGDCCSWKGVGCHNVTGNVIKLDLRNDVFSTSSQLEAGEVNPALLELKYLTYLDLSRNDFNGSRIPEFFGSMRQLQYLNLSYASFSGKVPPHLGNLTELVVLDLCKSGWGIGGIEANSLEWAFRLEKLQYLDLSGSNLTQARESLSLIHHLPSLSVLNLAFCGLGNSHTVTTRRNSTISYSNLQHLDLSGNLFSGPIPHFLQNLSSIRFLDLSWNDFISSIPPWLGNKVDPKYLSLADNSFNGSFPLFIQNSSSLTSLFLSGNQFSSSIPSWLANKTELEYLYLSGNQFNRVDGGITNTIGCLCRLRTLALSFNQLQEEVAESHVNFSRCSRYDLQYLYMENNNISGYLPIIGSLSSLLELDLSSNNLEGLPPSLAGLSSLESLDLSHNNFNVVAPIIGSLSSLLELDLSSNNLEGLPPSLAGLSSLNSLDLSYNNFSVMSPIIGSLLSLRSLDLSFNHLKILPPSLRGLSSLINLYSSSNHFRVMPPLIGRLSSLQTLDLSNNTLEVFPPFLGGLSSLNFLDLSYNNLSVVSSVIGNLSSLQSLYLSNNNLETLPPSLGRLSSLNFLDLSYNNLSVVSSVIGNLSSLQTLYLSNNNLETPPPSLGRLSSLNFLDLSYNNLSVVSSVIGNLSSLQTLDLSNNSLETLPPSLGRLSSLNSLDLSYNNLSVVHQASLANLSSLSYLDISSNSAILDLSPDWMPPFQLESLSIRPCKLNSPFPNWVLSQKRLLDLDLSDSGIFGPLPVNIGNAMPSLQSLRLAINHINGSIPRSLCGIAGLGILDLQKNRLSGKIPDCWENSQIVGVELSSNRLSGHIPNSLTKVATLQLLSLNNNSLEGELPLALSNSAKLTILDVGKNNLHGEIPPWNGAIFPFLQILILRENRFNGTIPLQLCLFHALHIIDLASNNLVGTIPRCFGYFQGMGPAALNITYYALEPTDEWSAVEVIKGEEREYTTNLHLLANMDLSCNQLVGVIPAEITSLSLLLGLNLSHNHLNGTIPMEIGKMRSLESLDLSFNNLYGSIPETISSLDSLSKMNFSFNNLQGQIPTGRHLQTLNDSSIYMGNPGLCGDPLPKKCFGDNTAHPPTSAVLEEEGDNKREKMWFYMVIMLGFAVGFWGVIGILVVHKRWRHAYFQIAEELADWIYVRVAVMIARVSRGR